MMDRSKSLPALGEGGVFRILVVDDDRAGAYLLREPMRNLRCRSELHFVWDGVEALDFLHRRGSHIDAPRPNLILLDVNMPRLGGLETLSAIKGDPELYAIPVIMLSVSNAPEDVRESYLARANCYVQKPLDLDRSVKLVQAVETLWMDFALLPEPFRGRQQDLYSTHSKTDTAKSATLEVPGKRIAPIPAEARSQTIHDDSPASKIATRSRKSNCEEHSGLLDELGEAVRELLQLHEQQFRAIVDEDSDCTRFDLLIHMANEKKQRVKYAYLRHVEAHGCSNQDDFK
jgi:two-component system, chemotaxis family, response regulator Rcp1